MSGLCGRELKPGAVLSMRGVDMVLEECRVWVRFTGTVIATPPGITAFPQPGIMPCSGSSVHLIGRLRARFSHGE